MNLTNSNNDPSTGLLPRRGAARRGADQAQVLGHLQRVPLPRHKVRLWLNLALTIQLFIATSLWGHGHGAIIWCALIELF